MIPVRDGLEVLATRPAHTSWKVPAFCNNDWAAIRFLQVCEEMGAERPFDIAYGSPFCAWSGGRPSAIRRPLSERELDLYFSTYAQHGARVALTFSKLAIDDSSLNDPYCNLLLDYAEKYNGEVILVEDKLARHVRKTHPNIKLIASLNKCMCELRKDYSHETDYYRRLLETFDEVVVRCEYAIDDALIQQLGDVKERVEIIVNQFCVPNCQHCYEHISAVEKWNDSGQMGNGPSCFYLKMAGDITNRLTENLFISNKRINELVESGFYKMKLAGRNAPLPKFIDMFATYIFEPTGVINFLRNDMMREFKTLAQTHGASFNPCSLDLARNKS